MDYFMKNKILIGTIVVLVAINLVTLVTLWTLPGKQTLPPFGSPPGLGPQEFIERELRFSDEQKKEFAQLRNEHQQAARNILEQLRKAKTDLFALVRVPDLPENILEEKQREIGRLQSELDMTTFRHFQKIRSMCTEQQRTRFDVVMDEMLRLLGAPPASFQGGEGRPDFGGPPLQDPPR